MSLGSWLTLWIAGVSVLVTLPLVDIVVIPFSCMLHQHTLKIMITSLSGRVLRVLANTTHRSTCLFHPPWVALDPLLANKSRRTTLITCGADGGQLFRVFLP